MPSMNLKIFGYPHPHHHAATLSGGPYHFIYMHSQLVSRQILLFTVMMAHLEQVDVLPAAAAQGRHVAAGVEGGGLTTLGDRAPGIIKTMYGGADGGIVGVT